MNFDDHEIWGAPARPATTEPESPAVEAPAVPSAATSDGRLYRSAGSEPYPEAILALPQHRRHTTAIPVEATQWATPAVSAPVSINSRIPRPVAVEDAAIAEVLATPSVAESPTGFTAWFKQPAATPSEEPRPSGTGAPSGLTPRPTDSGTDTAFFSHSLNAGRYAALLFVVTAAVATANAAFSSTLGMPTGIALVIGATFGAWQISAASRWAAWVLPAYVLIAAVLVAGQFTANAPGASPLGQLLLVVTELITLAPWLTAATVIGVALPALRGRAA